MKSFASLPIVWIFLSTIATPIGSTHANTHNHNNSNNTNKNNIEINHEIRRNNADDSVSHSSGDMPDTETVSTSTSSLSPLDLLHLSLSPTSKPSVSPTLIPTAQPEIVTCEKDEEKQFCSRESLKGMVEDFFYTCEPTPTLLWKKCGCKCTTPTVSPTQFPSVAPTTLPTLAPTDCDNSKILLKKSVELLDLNDENDMRNAFNAKSNKKQCSSLDEGLTIALGFLNTPDSWRATCCNDIFHVVKNIPSTMNKSEFLDCSFCQAPTIETTTTMTTMTTMTMTTATITTTPTPIAPTSANTTRIFSTFGSSDSESSGAAPDMSMMLVLIVAAALCVVGFSYREKIQQNLGWGSSSSSSSSRVYSRTRSSNAAVYSAVQRDVY